MFTDYDSVLVRSKAELDAVRSRIEVSPVLSFDFETAGLIDHTVWGVGFAVPPSAGMRGLAAYIGCETDCTLDFLTDLKPWLEQLFANNKHVVGQNLKFDQTILREYGFRNIPHNLFDVMVGSWMLSTNQGEDRRHGLDAIAKRFLKIEVSKDLMEIREKYRGKDQELYWLNMKRYGTEDVIVPLKLRSKMIPMLEKHGLKEQAKNLEMPMVSVTAEMEMNGVKPDVPHLTKIRAEIEAEARATEAEIHAMVSFEFNIGSTQQLSDALFDDPRGINLAPHGEMNRGKERKDKKTGELIPGAWSTAEEVMKSFDHPVCAKVLDYRSLEKLIGTYIDPFVEKAASSPDGRVHASFHQTGTATGRFASSKPNLQNLPKKKGTIRKGIIAEDGFVLVACDYSQIELRLMAHFSGDPVMVKNYMDGGDIHRITGAKMMGCLPEEVTKEQRDMAKPCVAEGQLVLTDNGLKPIEAVDKKDKVWDGVEWVQHDGVIYKGIREVIEYDGLTATPDHKVLTDTGGSIPFGEIASSLGQQRIAVGGDGEVPIRFVEIYRSGGIEARRETRRVPLLGVSRDEVDLPIKHPKRQDDRLPLSAERKVWARSKIGSSWRALRRYATAVSESFGSILRELWGSWYPTPLRVTGGFYPVDAQKSSPPYLSWNPVRPDQQRRSLRSWKHPSCVQTPEFIQQTNELRASGVQRTDGFTPPSLAPSENRSPDFLLPTGLGSEAHSGRTDTCGDTESVTKQPRLARVYDILNAGHRHRFTVSNKIVFNCNFGLLYGMSAKRLKDYAWVDYGVRITIEEANKFRYDYFDLYKYVVGYHNYIRDFVSEHGYTENFIGEKRFLVGHRSDDNYERWKAWSEGVNYTIQGSAAALIKLAMLKAYRELHRPFGHRVSSRYGRVVTLWDSDDDLAHEVRAVMQVHDELVYEVREEIAEPFANWLKHTMENAATGFRVPIIAEWKKGKSLEDCK